MKLADGQRKLVTGGKEAFEFALDDSYSPQASSWGEMPTAELRRVTG